MKNHSRRRGATVEQRVYDFILGCGGRVRHSAIADALELRGEVVRTATKRLAKRGAITKTGMTHSCMCKVVGPRPTDRRGNNAGSRKAWYGVDGKINKPGNDHRRRGPSKPIIKPEDAGSLWQVWVPSPCLHAANEISENPGAQLRPQQSEAA